MTARKRKCRYCKAYTREYVLVPLGAFCSEKHLLAYSLDRKNQEVVRRKKKDAERKENARKKREYYEQDLKTRREAAVFWFNKYIRLRDQGLPCISCGVPAGSCKFDAGHYIPAGSCEALRFNEWNVNSQCAIRCNVHESGNRTEYQKGLVAKYNQEVVDFLEGPQPLVKKTVEYYKAIEDKYKKKCKEVDLYSNKVPCGTQGAAF